VPLAQKHEAILIAQRVRELCEASVDPDDDLDETQGWLNEFVRTVKFKPGELREPGTARWQALVEVRKASVVPVGIKDGDGYEVAAADGFTAADLGRLVLDLRRLDPGWRLPQAEARVLVVDLLGVGLTDRQIVERGTVSTRTVERVRAELRGELVDTAGQPRQAALQSGANPTIRPIRHISRGRVL
jgi:hypothetical protein